MGKRSKRFAYTSHTIMASWMVPLRPCWGKRQALLLAQLENMRPRTITKRASDFPSALKHFLPDLFPILQFTLHQRSWGTTPHFSPTIKAFSPSILLLLSCFCQYPCKLSCTSSSVPSTLIPSIKPKSWLSRLTGKIWIACCHYWKVRSQPMDCRSYAIGEETMQVETTSRNNLEKPLVYFFKCF